MAVLHVIRHMCSITTLLFYGFISINVLSLANSADASLPRAFQNTTSTILYLNYRYEHGWSYVVIAI